MLKILVPIDFTDISINGFETACNFANFVEAEIYLLNFIDPPKNENFSATGDINEMHNSEVKRYVMALSKKQTERLEELVSQKAFTNKSRLIPRVRIDYFQDGVETFIEENQIDLVVMGTTGESTFSEIFVGNHTEQVIRTAHCPVLAVQYPAKDFRPQEILVATDLSLDGPVEIEYVKKFADWFSAKIHLLYVAKNSGEITSGLKDKVNERASAYQLKNYEIHLLSGDKEKTILSFAHELPADLIALTTHGRTGLSNLFFGSLSEDIVKDSKDIPILVLNKKMEENYSKSN